MGFSILYQDISPYSTRLGESRIAVPLAPAGGADLAGRLRGGRREPLAGDLQLDHPGLGGGRQPPVSARFRARGPRDPAAVQLLHRQQPRARAARYAYRRRDRVRRRRRTALYGSAATCV
ncbi:hypothetical protein BVI1335_1660008 [Burkholderia vietnamiensis]|nr:hypothetical protein BVI1335_1660008 [Burkholderia vietnamiensis]